jgi:DNA-binding CsgD family transcriptional regulator
VLVALTRKLDRSLLALQAAQSPASLARAAFGCVNALVSATEVHVIFSHGEGLPPKLFHVKEGAEPTESLLHVSWRHDPLVRLFMAQPPNEPFHLSTALSDQELAQSRFGTRWLRRPGAPHGVVFPIAGRVSSSALICLFRSKERGEFTPAEMEQLDWFGTHFKLAWLRGFVREESLAINYSLQNILRHSASGLILLNWDLKVVYRNTEASESCVFWNLGAEGARNTLASAVFCCPSALLEICQRLKSSWRPTRDAHRADKPENKDDSSALAVASESTCICRGPDGLRAEVHLVSLKAWALGRPMFHIHIRRARHHEHAHEQDGGKKNIPRHPARVHPDLARLTTRERELVDYVCRGLSNEMIARQLSKSVPTVKNQLRSIFQKLSLTSRMELMARMQPALAK